MTNVGSGDRSIDDWPPTAAFDVIRARADMLTRVRAFFADRGVLEVETPVLSCCAATDPALSSFHVAYDGPGAPPGRRLYLHTSPEFGMKRLLAAGSGDIYQITRAFRDGEAGRWHNPEFSLLEWYRVGYDHFDLMDEVETLIGEVLPPQGRFQRLSYRALFEDHVDIDPLSADADALAALARDRGIEVNGELPRTGWLDLLFTHLIEPALVRLEGVFVYGFPAAQASLARLDPADPRLAERFELYVRGVELANGFHELKEREEQAARFLHDNLLRRASGLVEMPIDGRLLAALGAGVPDCAGVALGLDRLLMLKTGANSIDEVLAFPVARA